MFQREVQAVLGRDFLQAAQQGRSPSGTQTGTQGGPARRPSKNTSTNDDLGIMKALSSMGTAAKKNLNQLALRFQGNAADSNDPREFKPLVGNDVSDYSRKLLLRLPFRLL